MTHDPEKYSLEINSAYGPVFGDHAQVTQNFFVNQPPTPPLDPDDLRQAIYRAGTLLRDIPADIGGQHLVRPEVDQILDWLHTTPPGQRLGLLLDQPGSGKSVILRDVLHRLEAANQPVLAIKADLLSGVSSRADLADRLELPAPVETCIGALAAVEPVVVIIDQVDALSLALSRDQSTLDLVLGAAARLRHLANVRLLVSCRTFDLQQDPKLNPLKQDQTFTIKPLTEAQIHQVLQPWGITPAGPLLELLQSPLHLKIYVDLLTAGVAASEQFHSLQQLYAALWRLRIEPGPPETASAVYRLVELMQSQRQISAPAALLDDLPTAARHLQQVGFIRREGEQWQFAHQTLLDFCYARRFVARRLSLSEEILASPQGLFERSQLVQVLAYLRGEARSDYRREVATLLSAVTLRPHLRRLLIQWLATLPDPTPAEFGLIDGLLRRAGSGFQFLRAAADNPAWFDHLRPYFLPTWLHSDDDLLLGQVSHYLHRIIRVRPDSVLSLLQPYLNQSAAWNDRLAFCLSRLEDWSNPLALSTLQQLIAAGVNDQRIEGILFHLAQVDPAVGCAALRAYLDRRLQQVLADKSDAIATARFRLEDRLLGQRATIARQLENAAENAPEAVVKHLLPWFVQAALAVTSPFHSDVETYPSDSIFAWGWDNDPHLSDGVTFAMHLSQALGEVAQSEPGQFRQLAQTLARVETTAVQRVLAHAFLADPVEFAADIAAYLLADRRRWDLGEERDDTCRLLGAAFPHLTRDLQEQLAAYILDYRPAYERYGRWYGLTQLRLLAGIPVEFLPEPAYRRRQELKRKFPDFELKPPPGVQFGWVGPPIEPEAVAKMSDAAWLQAIQKYGIEGKVHPDFLREGSQLPRLVTEQTQKEPVRFYRLAQQFDEAVPVDYFVAVINGLADADAPAGWLFDLVRCITPRLSSSGVRRPVCWALGKRAADGVPDDLLDLLADWALHDDSPSNIVSSPTPEGRPAGDNLHQFGINTNRGAALRAACRSALKRQPPQPERALALLERAAADPSPAVRSCVIYQLVPLLNEDEERTLAIFMATVSDQPVLLQTSLAHRFLYWTYYRHFPTTRPLIEKLLHNDDPPTQQAGARLICLAAMTYPEAVELEQQVMGGPAPWRRGAAEVYARNLGKMEVQMVCRSRLGQLMHDPDEQVRRYVGDCFQWLLPEQLADVREFVTAFLDSPALLDGAMNLVGYLAQIVDRDPALVLAAVEKILAAAGREVTNIHSATAIVERELVQLLLAIYHHASDDPALQTQAMSRFEQMLQLNSHFAQRALDDYDRH